MRENMIKLKAPKRQYEVERVTISSEGQLALKGTLKKILLDENKKTTGISIYVSEDLREMEIEKDESSEMQFSKSGHMKHIKFLSMLEEMKYKIPAEYLGEWNEERGCWVGHLQEVTEAPKSKMRRRKTNENVAV